MTIALRVSGIECGWANGAPEVKEPDQEIDISDNFRMLPIHGRTGYGKTTLLNVLSGYMAPLCGTIDWHIAGENYTWNEFEPLSAGDRRRLPFGIARQGSDLPRAFKIRQTIEGLLSYRGYTAKDASARMEEAVSSFLIESESLCDIVDKYPHEISGGQRQRAAMACAIAHEPSVLFADEPTGSLDVDTSQDVLDAVHTWLYPENGDAERAFVFVTHDLNAHTSLLGNRKSDVTEPGIWEVILRKHDTPDQRKHIEPRELLFPGKQKELTARIRPN